MLCLLNWACVASDRMQAKPLGRRLAQEKGAQGRDQAATYLFEVGFRSELTCRSVQGTPVVAV